METILDVAPQPDHEAAPSAGPLHAPSVPTAQLNLDAWPVWDDGALARIVGNNPNAHARLLNKYRESASLAMAELQLCAKDGEWLKAAAVAHKLKSSSRSVGAMRLGQLCEALEHAGHQGDAAACAALVPLVLAGFAEVQTRL